MKCSELSAIVSKAANLVAATRGNVAGADDLNSLLRIAPDRTVAQLAKGLATVVPRSSDAALGRVSEAAALLLGLHDVLSGIAKAAIVADLATLGTSLAPHANSDLAELIADTQTALAGKKVTNAAAPVREEVVRAYNHALEQALGDDDGFALVLRRLQNDPDVKISEVVALAKRFAFASTKSRATAMKKIQARHQSLMTSRAKAAATAGRIAG
jgi:hypothetical protein